MFTFPCTTNQARALTFEGAFDLHKNLVIMNKTWFEKSDKGKKKNLTVNKPNEDKDQALESTTKGEKCTELREDMSLWKSSIFVSVRLWPKLKFQESGYELPRTTEMVRFSHKQLYKDQGIESTKVGYPSIDLPKNGFSPHSQPLSRYMGRNPGKLVQ